MAKTVDYSGYTVKAGEVLDLHGKTIVLTRPIKVCGCIRNGTLDGTKLAQFDGALEFPAGVARGRAFDLKFQGHSFSGFAKVKGNDVRIENIVTLPCSGWSVQVLGADRCIIRNLNQLNSRRGGVYFGDGTAFGTDLECRDCVLEDSKFVTSDEEAIVRANTAVNLLIRRTSIDNTKCRAGKEAFQGRGLSGRIEDSTIYGSTSNGQQPNGRTQTAVFQFIRTLIYGYNSAEAGGTLTFTGCDLIHRPTYQGRTLATPGNGCVANPQSAARGLPDGAISLIGCRIDAKAITVSPKKVKIVGGTFNGKPLK